MGGAQDGKIHFADECHNTAATLRVDAGEGLVQQQELFPLAVGQAAGQCHPPPHSAGQFFREQHGCVGQADGLQPRCGTFSLREHDSDLPGGGQPGQEPIFLKEQCGVSRGVNGAALGGLQPGQQAEQGGFAAPGGSGQRRDAFVWQLQ